MKELGEYLKEVRMNNSVELEEAASDLELQLIELENIEEGNIKAFKDVLSLKEIIREYSKYLGLDSDKVIDEFNDFLFEHTSKINLDDILEAVNKSEKKDKKEKKITSPYTHIKVKRVNKKLVLNFLSIITLILLLVAILYFLFAPEESVINSELKNTVGSVVNEFA